MRANKLARLMARDGDCCHWCRRRFDDENPPTFEHLIPRKYGGTRDDWNLVLSCAACNNTRHHYVSCEKCGNRIRHFDRAAWEGKRVVYHDRCAPAHLLVGLVGLVG